MGNDKEDMGDIEIREESPTPETDPTENVVSESLTTEAEPTESVVSESPAEVELEEYTDEDFEYRDFEALDIETYEDYTDEELAAAAGDDGEVQIQEYVTSEQKVNSEMGDLNSNDKKKMPAGLVVLYAFVVFAVAISIWIAGTRSGSDFAIKVIATYLHGSLSTKDRSYVDDTPATVPITKDSDGVDLDDDRLKPEDVPQNPVPTVFVPRSEDYVKTFLLFGIEEIDGAANTDSMILVSVNTRDNTIKLVSLLRDTYVSCPGYYPNKLNSVYARAAKKFSDSRAAKEAGGHLLMSVIENTYDIDISGYACVNFNSFKAIIDRIGGVDVKLSQREADYLNTTNYIADKQYRTTKEGINHMNGEQALGYCRVRKVPTWDGVGSDFGRTLRQRRVISAIVDQYKSLSIFEMLDVMTDCLNYIYTDVSEEQMNQMLQNIYYNKIFTLESMQLPVDKMYQDSGKEGIFNGNRNVTYTLVIDDYREENIAELHRFIFLDPVENEDGEQHQ